MIRTDVSRSVPLLMVVCTLCLWTITSYAETPYQVVGSYTVHLKKPVDEATATIASRGALANLRSEIFSWLRETSALDWDTTYSVDSIFLDRLMELCRKNAHKESIFNGSDWTLSYTVDAQNLANAVKAYNSKNDTLALIAYRRFLTSELERDFKGIYVNGLKALVYGGGHIGAPLNIPGKLGIDLTDRVRTTVDSLFNGISLTSDIMILEGKPGNYPANPVKITVKNGNMPAAGLLTGGFLPDGKQVFSLETDSDGQIVLDSIKLPFVANGSFFNILLTPGKQIDPATPFTLSAIHADFKRRPDHTLMFKLSKPTYTLSYRANAASDLSIPPDFSKDAIMKTFLKDSCHLQGTPDPMNADLAFDVRCQVSQYYFDAREETVVKVEMMVAIDDRSSSPPVRCEKSSTYEKPYKLGVNIPVGLFFWETTRELQKFVKKTLQEM